MITSAYDAEEWRKFHKLQEATSEPKPMKAELHPTAQRQVVKVPQIRASTFIVCFLH